MKLFAASLFGSKTPGVDSAIYISATGNDSNNGTASDPVATFARAQELVRASASKNTIYAYGGVYREEVIFTELDSNVNVIAAPGTELRGSVQPNTITNEGGGIYSFPLSDGDSDSFNAQTLFINGARAQQTRYPATGNRSVSAYSEVILVQGNWRWPEWVRQTLTLDATTITKLRTLSTADLQRVQIHTLFKWMTNKSFIETVHPTNNTITTLSSGRLSFQQYDGTTSYFYLTNLPFDTDVSGVWYQDGTKYYHDGAVSASSIEIPVIQKPLQFKGFNNLNKVKNVTWSINIKYSKMVYPQQGGYNTIQAAVDHQGAVEWQYAKNCLVKDCTVSHLGEFAGYLFAGTEQSGFDSVLSYDIGAGFVRIGESNIPDANSDRPNVFPAPFNNTVNNCLAYNLGRFNEGAAGIIIGWSHDNKISKNTVHDLYYTGVSVGWVFKDGTTECYNNIIEYNEIYNICQTDQILDDGGGVYTLGEQFGTKIRHNIIHDVYGNNLGGMGVYNDEWSQEIETHGNLIWNCSHRGLNLNYGSNNTWRNNVLQDFSDDGLRYNSIAGGSIGLNVFRNIVIYKSASGEELYVNTGFRNSSNLIDFNCYWNLDGSVYILGETFAQWQARGKDINGLEQYPGTLDKINKTFTIDSSVASAINFEPLQTDLAGSSLTEV